MLPATINVQEPPELRDHTRIQDSALYLNTRARPWFAPPGQPRRAGVSSFGFGGANYHAVSLLGLYVPRHTAAPTAVRCEGMRGWHAPCLYPLTTVGAYH